MCSCRAGVVLLVLSAAAVLPSAAVEPQSSSAARQTAPRSDYQLTPVSPLKLKVMRLAQGGKPLEAMRELVAAIQAEPSNEEAYELASELYGKTKQDKRAVEFFDRFATASPELALPRYYRGLHQLRLARTEEAAASFRAAAAIPPGHAMAQFELGKLLEAAGDTAGALAAYRAANALAPRELSLAGALSRALNRAGEYEATLQVAQGALANASESAELNHAYGRAQLSLGDLGAAETSLRRALKLDPGLIEAHRDLEALLIRAERPDEARTHAANADWLEGTTQLIREAEQLMSESPQDPRYPLFLAELHLARDEVRPAYEKLELALQGGGDASRIAAGRAWVFTYRGNMESAKLELDALVGVEGARVDLSRAAVMFAAGKSEAAQEHLQRAIRAAPEDRPLLVQASLLWRMAGMSNEADRILVLAHQASFPALPRPLAPAE